LPGWRRLVSHFRAVIDHHFLNLAASAPTLLLPVVVNACLGPAVNAAFYVAWMVYTVGLLVPASLTSVLYSIGGADPAAMPSRMRLSMALSAAFALVASVLLALFPHLLLGLFNADYPALAASAVRFFGLGLFGAVAKQHLVLVARSKQRMRWGTKYLAVSAVSELALAAVGGLLGDVSWLTIGWLSALAINCAFQMRPVLRFSTRLPQRLLAAETGAL
jgi:Na+-driven multidrug efflux pump